MDPPGRVTGQQRGGGAGAAALERRRAERLLRPGHPKAGKELGSSSPSGAIFITPLPLWDVGVT